MAEGEKNQINVELMADCRVYLFTYKRNQLLQRAVQSLLNQTHHDWICEVHNDCPEDPFPSLYLESLNDARLVAVNHSVNLGPTKSFNLAYAGCGEKYASILEDDNWWEPEFLTKMIAVMETHPKVDVAWSNMRVWKQTTDITFYDTGKTIWESQMDKLFEWPVDAQAMGALHSNGSMMYRGNKAGQYTIPDKTEFAAVELVRERTFKFPIYFVGEPLANFSQTLATNRSNDAIAWTATQAMLLTSFIQTSTDSKAAFGKSLEFFRGKKPSPLATFFVSAVYICKDTQLLKLLSSADWYSIGRWLLRNMFSLPRLKRYLASQQNVMAFLLEHTRKRHLQNGQ